MEPAGNKNCYLAECSFHQNITYEERFSSPALFNYSTVFDKTSFAVITQIKRLLVNKILLQNPRHSMNQYHNYFS